MPQKGKHRPPHRREKRQRTRTPAQNVQEISANETSTAASASKPAPAAKLTSRQAYTGHGSASLTKARYPFLATELKWIGIVAAVIIVVLIILAIVVPPLFA